MTEAQTRTTTEEVKKRATHAIELLESGKVTNQVEAAKEAKLKITTFRSYLKTNGIKLNLPATEVATPKAKVTAKTSKSKTVTAKAVKKNAAPVVTSKVDTVDAVDKWIDSCINAYERIFDKELTAKDARTLMKLAPQG